MIFHLLAGKFGHGNRVHLRRRDVTTAQQLAGVFTLAVGAAKVLPNGQILAASRAALIALNDRAIVAFNLELVASTS